MTGIHSRQTKGSQRIRDDIRGSRQVFTGCRGKVHDALDAVQHIPGLPAGHRHILHSGGSFGGGKLGLGTHLAGLFTQGIEVRAGRTENGGDPAHFLIKVCRCFDSRCT